MDKKRESFFDKFEKTKGKIEKMFHHASKDGSKSFPKFEDLFKTQSLQAQPTEEPKAAQAKPTLNSSAPKKPILKAKARSVTIVLSALAMMAGMSLLIKTHVAKMTKFNYLQSVHDNENAVVVTADQAKVVIEKLATPNQSAQASVIIDAHTGVKIEAAAEPVVAQPTYTPPRLEASLYSAPPTSYQVSDSAAILNLINQKKATEQALAPQLMQQPMVVAPQVVTMTREQFNQFLQQQQQAQVITENQTFVSANNLV